MSTLTQEARKIAIDYGKSVEELVRAGRYDYANSDVTAKNFPPQGKGTAQLDAVLVHLNRYVESEEVLAELEKVGLRAGTLQELLAFGVQYPNVQREYPIVALGSVWRDPYGDRYVPYLWGRGSERHLDLRWFDYSWGDHDRFLAFRK